MHWEKSTNALCVLYEGNGPPNYTGCSVFRELMNKYPSHSHKVQTVLVQPAPKYWQVAIRGQRQEHLINNTVQTLNIQKITNDILEWKIRAPLTKHLKNGMMI